MFPWHSASTAKMLLIPTPGVATFQRGFLGKQASQQRIELLLPACVYHTPKVEKMEEISLTCPTNAAPNQNVLKRAIITVIGGFGSTVAI